MGINVLFNLLKKVQHINCQLTVMHLILVNIILNHSLPERPDHQFQEQQVDCSTVGDKAAVQESLQARKMEQMKNLSQDSESGDPWVGMGEGFFRMEMLTYLKQDKKSL